MYIRYNEKQQDQYNESEIETACKRQKFTTNDHDTDPNDIFTLHMPVVLANTACDFIKAFQTTKGVNTSWLEPRTTCQVNTLF
jgi:hypothetical protein